MQKRLTEIIRGERPSLSFEVFPPKKSADFETVRQATEQIAALHPSYMSVTYGAGGGTSNYTLAVAQNLESRFGVPVLAHLSCVSSTRAGIRTRLDALRTSGLEIYSPCAAICLRIQTPPNWNFITPPNW